MASEYVREIGRLKDADGLPVIIGVDFGRVTISTGIGSAAAFSRKQREDFTRLLFEAGRQAALYEPDPEPVPVIAYVICTCGHTIIDDSKCTCPQLCPTCMREDCCAETWAAARAARL